MKDKAVKLFEENLKKLNQGYIVFKNSSQLRALCEYKYILHKVLCETKGVDSDRLLAKLVGIRRQNDISKIISETLPSRRTERIRRWVSLIKEEQEK